MFRITKEYHIAYAHRLLGNQFGCNNLHGHNGTIIIGLKSENLKDGMIMDFNKLDKTMSTLLVLLDHSCITGNGDESLQKFLEQENSKYFCLTFEPTAENICKFIYEYVWLSLRELLDYVEFYETDKAGAMYSEY